MRLARIGIVSVAVLLLGGGYLASQWAFLQRLETGSTEATLKYYRAIDSPSVSAVSLLLLAGCVVLASMRQEPDGQ